MRLLREPLRAFRLDPDRFLRPGQAELAWLLPLALALAPMAGYLPGWLSVAWGLSATTRLAGWQHRVPAWLRLVIAGLMAAGVFAEYHTVLGPDGGVALLVGMSALKVLETESGRDRAFLALMGYFLLMAPLIHDQSLPLAAYLLAVAVLQTASLIALQPGGDARFTRRIRVAGSLMLQALPLALLLFLLFPRLPAPIGGLMQTRSGQTGLSDSMSPGSVSELIQSDAIAFRVEFESSPPPATELYWRGPVLWDYDGRTWRPARNLPLTPVESRALGRETRYVVTLEPHHQHWLFTLGLPARSPDVAAEATADFTWRSRKPVDQRLRYTHAAFLDYVMEIEPDPAVRALALQLPAGRNPETAALMRAWRAEGLNDEGMMRRALDHFRQAPFYYSLRPPRLGEHSVDDFLQRTRRGFCEHYSGAFVVMMRMAGIPARVVTGYLGGERNPLSDYWIVRQRDAHAWAEVWLPGRGWLRVDPTAAVAPQRVEQGIEAALPAAERPAGLWQASFLRPIAQAWDMLDTSWQRWVIGYDRARQESLLASLHPLLGSLRGMLWALAGVIALALLVLLIGLRPRRARQPVDEAARLYARLLTGLRRAGLDTPAQEGPRDLARRVAFLHPAWAAEFEAIIDRYIALRYAASGRTDCDDLRARISRFKPWTRP